MTPRKKDRRQPPGIIPPVADESNFSLEEEESCSESSSKSGISRNDDGATC